jgi:hypothetical protein
MHVRSSHTTPGCFGTYNVKKFASIGTFDEVQLGVFVGKICPGAGADEERGGEVVTKNSRSTTLLAGLGMPAQRK